MFSARISRTSAAAATCAGTAAWCSSGALALTDVGARAARVGVLPAPWWLLVAIAAAIAIVWAVRLSADRARPLFFSLILCVPWLPVPLPQAALAWTGPVSLGVWAVIAAAIAVAGKATGGRRGAIMPWLSTPRPASRVAGVLALIVYLAAFGRIGWMLPDGDELHYLIIAQSLWRDGDLAIENNHARGDYREYVGRDFAPDFLRRGADGQIYSVHLPGEPALVAPVLAVGGHRLVGMTLALVSATATAVAWRTAFALTASAAAAWFGWAAVALSAPFLLLAFTVYPDGPGAAVLLLAATALLALHTRPDRRAGWWLFAGLAPALLPWFHARFAVLAALLVIVPYVLVASMYQMWWGSLSSPARFAGSTLLLVVPAAMAFAAVREAASRAAQAVLLALSGATTLLLLWIDRGLLAFNTRDEVAPWLVWLGQLADLARGWPSLFRTSTEVAALSALTWAAALAGAWGLARALARRRQMQPGAAGLLLLGTGALAVMLALGVVWRVEGRAGRAATIGQLRTLEAANAGRQMIGVRLEPPALTSPSRALEDLRISAERTPDGRDTDWFWLSRLPAGRYRAWIDHGASDGPFGARLYTGRSDQWLARWHADRLADGRSSFDLDIPVGVESFRITGDEASRRPVRAIHLQRLESRPAIAGLAEDCASPSGLYGDLTIYGVAGGAFFEPEGIWTRGTLEAELVVAGAPGRMPTTIWIGAGAVETTIAVSAGSYADRSTYQAGERRLVELPTRPGKPLVLRVRAEKGFRPSDLEPGNADRRQLGARIAPAGAGAGR